MHLKRQKKLLRQQSITNSSKQRYMIQEGNPFLVQDPGFPQ